jgi:hypothetical protein
MGHPRHGWCGQLATGGTQRSWGTAARSAAVLDVKPLCVSTPEEQGMDSTVLSRAIRGNGGESKGLHSLLVVRRGCLVIEARATNAIVSGPRDRSTRAKRAR